MILPQLLVNSLISGSTYALVSVGLSLTYSMLRILNFAHGHLMMVGAYLFFLAYSMLGWGIILSGIFTVIMMSIVALLTLKIFVMPFLKYSYLLVFVTTLALSIILESVISIFFGVSVKSLTVPFNNHSWEIWGVYITPLQVIIIISALVLLSIVAIVIHSTPVGRKLRALAAHDHATQSLGVNKRRLSMLTFGAAVLLAAYVGVLVGFEMNMQPTMGHMYTIKAFAAMILGGLGNVWGTVIGSYLLGLVENLSIGLDWWGWSLPAGYKDAFAFLIILLVLLFRPQGLFGSKKRRE